VVVPITDGRWGVRDTPLLFSVSRKRRSMTCVRIVVFCRPWLSSETLLPSTGPGTSPLIPRRVHGRESARNGLRNYSRWRCCGRQLMHGWSSAGKSLYQTIPVNLSLTLHNSRRSLLSTAWLESFTSRFFMKYFPLIPSTAGEVAR
jgi:hypothetical protein